MVSRGDDFAKRYVPAQGDIVHLDWAPSLGHEIRGPQYGVVLSRDAYNVGTGLVVVAPITCAEYMTHGAIAAIEAAAKGAEAPVRRGPTNT